MPDKNPGTQYLAALWFALLSLAVGAAWLSGGLGWLDAKLLDLEFQVIRKIGPRPAVRDVVVVGIDVDDLRRFNDPKDFWHPHYGRFLAAIADAKPAVVGLDIVFPERSYQRLVPGIDQSLMRGLLAIRQSAPLVIARTVDDFKAFRPIFPPYLAITGANSVGSVLVCRDDDEVIRRFDEYLCDNSRSEPLASLAGLMAKHLGVSQPWRGIIDFGVGAPLSYIPFREVIDWSDRDDPRLKAAFAGKPVLLGFILPFEDRKNVPVDLAALEPGNHLVPGVFVHAQILRSMLNGGLVQQAPAILIALLILAGAGFWLMPSAQASRLALLGFLVAVALLALLALMFQRTFVPVAGPILAALLGAGARYVHATTIQARERALLRNSFGGYVSPQVMKAILAGSVHPGLEGERREVAILFSDIRDFTRRSEGISPESLIDMLNQYFAEMTDVVHANDGTVDKFIGDGMMAFFGAPQRLDNPSQNAANAALQMLDRVELLNRKLVGQGHDPLRIGIGIHFGEVVIGHVGSATRHEYTAIGDTVNTASRVEGLTKEAGCPLLVTQPVFAALASREGFVDLGSMEIRGHSAIDVFGHSGAKTPGRSA